MTKMVTLTRHRRGQRRRGADRGQEHRREQSRQMLLVRRATPIGAGCSAAAGSAGVAFDTATSRGRLWRHHRRARRAPTSRMTRPRSRQHMKSERIEIEVALGAGAGNGAGDRHRPRPRLHQGKCEDIMTTDRNRPHTRPGAALHPALHRQVRRGEAGRRGDRRASSTGRSPRTCCCCAASACAASSSMAAARRSTR